MELLKPDKSFGGYFLGLPSLHQLLQFLPGVFMDYFHTLLINRCYISYKSSHLSHNPRKHTCMLPPKN